MTMLGLVEAQRAGQRIDGGNGRADGASLLQPDVPIHPDTSQFGHLLAPQARSAARPLWQAEFRWQ